MMFGTRERFGYFLCVQCGCLQIETIPDDLHRYYPDDYYSHGAGLDVALPWHSRILRRLRTRPALFGRGYKAARLISRWQPMPSVFHEVHPHLLRDAGLSGFDAPILDVGCGDSALWLRKLQQIGFNQLWGVDPFIPASRNNDGVQLVKCSVADLVSDKEGDFELVAFHHSLEHIPDQESTLRDAARLLCDGGTCIVRIPALPCAAWDHYRTDWVELDAPRHLYIHSRKSIISIAERAGLSLKKLAFDTSSFEYLGSEQYRRNIPLIHPDSFWVNDQAPLFTEAEVRSFQVRAEAANAAGTAGRAVFVFGKTRASS